MIRQEQCDKVCRILDNILANRPTERDSLIVAVQKAFDALEKQNTGRWIPSDSELEIKCNKCGKDFSDYVCSIDYVDLVERPKFCPNCGAKMKGGEQK